VTVKQLPDCIWLRKAIPLILVLAAHPALAEVRCVDSVPALNAAIERADEVNVEIRLVQGTYNLTNSCLDTATPCGTDDDVVIKGGYTAGCASQTLDARLTVLTRPGGGIALSTGGNAFEGNGDIELSNLRINATPDGVRLDTTGNFALPDVEVRLSRVWLSQTRLRVVSDEVFATHVLVADAPGGCGFTVDYSELDYFQLSHSTIANSLGDGLCVGSIENDGLRMVVQNSIVWGSGGDDISVTVDPGEVVDATLNHNTYASLATNRPLQVAPVATLNSDPQFVNPVLGDYELGGTSGSINSALLLANSWSDRDLKGDARLFGGGVDRGALESPIGSTAATLTVTNSNNSGAGSLRQAILDANASSNLNTIRFAIGSTCGPQVINLGSTLPDITGPVYIDGYSQPGALRNTSDIGNNGSVCIVLNGFSGTGSLSAIVVPEGAAAGTSVRIEGLGFGGFDLAAITFSGGSDHAVSGSRFGGSLGALVLDPSGYGVQVGREMTGVQIGGSLLSDRNVFADATIAAISIAGSGSVQPSGVVVENNYIGTTPGGGSAEPNQRGIIVRGFNNRIRNNLISNNLQDAIELDDATATGNIVEYNTIGLPPLCVFAPCDSNGNGGHGVLIRDGATRNIVRNNEIAYNGGDGIAVVSAAGNPFYANAIYGNSGEGVDLGDDGYTANNNDSSATLPVQAGNENINAPVLGTASGGAATGTVAGTYSSRNGWYRLDFYAADNCPNLIAADAGQGRYRLSTTNVQITNAGSGVDGSVAFSGVPISRANTPTFFDQPRFVLATATRYQGTSPSGALLGTSEFSKCSPYQRSPDLFSNGFE
jgi:parallel beta-helix repeat protein